MHSFPIQRVRSVLSLSLVGISVAVAELRAAPTPDPETAAATPHSGTAVRTEADLAADALAVLAAQVERQSHPDALRRAFLAYYAFEAAHPQRVRKPYLFFVDFGLDNRTPRGYVFDMAKLTVVEGPFTVSHGRGSAPGAASVPTRFSNVRHSNATSLGLFLTQETYAFRGRSGGRRYQSIGLRMQGVSGAFNDAARARGIVAHGAPYVTAAQAGRSEGCPAIEQARARRLLPRIANGALVFHFSPHDEAWLRADPWAGAQAASPGPDAAGRARR